LIDFSEIESRLRETDRVWVRLYDGTRICLVEVLDSETFKAKFLPCARNSREYVIRHNEIKDFAPGNWIDGKWVHD